MTATPQLSAEQMQGALVAASIYQKLLAQYPDFAPLFEAVPELRPLFIQSITGNWTPTKFAEELHKTHWWQVTPESARLWLATSASDPAQASQQRQNTVTEYYRIAAQEGISVPLQQMASLAETGLSQGWTDAQIRDHIVGFAKQKDPLTGTLDSTVSQLKQTASDYGVPTSDPGLFDWAKKIRSNTATMDGFTETMREHAKSMFPALSSAIDRGVTVRQYADPYAQMAAQTLEINPSDFNVTDPKWSQALQQRDKSGQMVPMTLSDWQSHMMSDPKYGWDKTRNAQADATNVVQSLGQMFGTSA